MGRPKLAITSAELSAEISRVQQENQAHLRQLEERRRTAETRENERRGQLILHYLRSGRAIELRQALLLLVEPGDRSLFLLDEGETASAGAP